MSGRVSLKVEASASGLDQIAGAAEEMAERESWPADLSFWVNLVLEEMTVNVVNYGGEVSEIEVSLASDSESITIEITDDGAPFDPLTEAPEPDIEAKMEDRRIGGLGVHIVRTVMDELHYRREEGKNHLVMTKQRVE
jgi:anti-sigma regulatory factor (Ser/Thr protein kinase)